MTERSRGSYNPQPWVFESCIPQVTITRVRGRPLISGTRLVDEERFCEFDLKEIYQNLHRLPDDVVHPADLDRSKGFPVIDVRSPGEFHAGHIPGAVNVALFSDEQRAAIGTVYKRQGSDAAVAIGLEIAESRLPYLVEALKTALRGIDCNGSLGNRPVIHCWRGGMRSRSVGWLCGQLGFEVSLLEGGYKSYRRFAMEQLNRPRKIVVLAGPTGCGKTRILCDLSDNGEQVIDLEGLANHRGSVFGGFPGVPQPTVEQFQNLVFDQWNRLDAERIIWVEGESQMIGKAVIPEPLWKQIVAAPMIFVDAAVKDRALFLLEDYGSRDVDAMRNAADRIRKRLGGLRHREAVEAIEKDDWYQFCMIMLEYYDRWYLKALEKRSPSVLQQVQLTTPGRLDDRELLVRLAKQLFVDRG